MRKFPIIAALAAALAGAALAGAAVDQAHAGVASLNVQGNVFLVGAFGTGVPGIDVTGTLSFGGFGMGTTGLNGDFKFSIVPEDPILPQTLTVALDPASVQEMGYAIFGPGSVTASLETFGTVTVPNFFVTAVPEPASAALALVGLLGLAWLRRRGG